MALNTPGDALKRRLRADAQAIKDSTRAAVNDTTRSVVAALYAAEREAFDRPTPYTVPAGRAEGFGSIRADYAGRDRGDAAVMVRNRGQVPGGAIPHESYLRAQILGGTRRLKRLEVALQRKGLMPAGWLAIPAGAAAGRNGGGGGARLDAYGNLSRGQAVQLLSYFQAFGAGNARANMGDKGRDRIAKDRRRRLKGAPSFVPGVGFVDSGARMLKVERGRRYFAVPGPGRSGGLSPGIWERQGFGQLGQGVRPVLIFVPNAIYKPRFPFEDIADRTARRNLPRFLQQRRRQALQGRRP
jgi:hypothetical protein